MKRSEFINRIDRNYDPEGHCLHSDIGAAEYAAYLAEKAGVQWDPEEPELPEQVKVRDGCCALWWEGRAVIGERGALYPVYREAAARYNAMGNILENDHGLIHTDHVGRVLRSEREKLQCAKT